MKLGKNFVAKLIASFLQEGKNYVYASLLSEKVGSELASTALHEAQHYGFLKSNYRINADYAAGQYLRNSLLETYEPGQSVVLVKNGKAYKGLVSDNTGGSYKLAFKGEAPAGHSEESSYRETDFGADEE